jgi:hypothetical protein
MPRIKTLKEKEKKVNNPDVQNILLESLKKYLIKNTDTLKIIYNIVENKHKIKLALIDYFVTIYSKKNSIYIEKEKEDYFYINDEYKNGLKSFTKKYFDPFKRKNKIEFIFDNITFTTTVGQLNFLKWTVENGILNYIEKIYDNIYKDHQKYLKNKKIKTEKLI